MTKYCGNIIFVKVTETVPGVYEEEPFSRRYKGDVEKNWRRWNQGDGINNNLNVNNTLSIVADSFLYENLGMIRAVEWMGSYWDVSSLEIRRPRLILEVGGVYNGPTPGTTECSGTDTWM